jgi:CheY-like chemotaxis protein
MQCSNLVSRNKKVVMICEDEQELLDLYSRVLALKYDIIKVCSGTECIREYLEYKTKGCPIDLLFLDYKLSDMLGDDVAKMIKKMNGIKIILISAYNLDEQTKNELFQNKYIEKFLQKPIRMRQIIQAATDTI